MVKIEHTVIDLTQFAQDHYQALLQSPFEIDMRLQEFTRDAGTLAHSQHAAFAQLLTLNLQTIVEGWPAELEKLKPTLFKAFNDVVNAFPITIPASAVTPAEKKKAKAKIKADLKKVYKNALEKVFDYKKFTGNYNGYGAYEFAKNLGVNVCPYCNRQYTFTLDTKTGKTRPELDHFLDKSSNPFFALSFFNLVPSCHICNSNLKGSKKFTNAKNLNPYTICFNDILLFSIEIKTIDFINGKSGSFNISLRPVIGAKKSDIKKAEKNAEIFHHSELYNNHHDLVVELIHKAYYYTATRRKEISELRASPTATGPGKKLFNDDAEVNRFITGAYTEVAELGKRPMSKLIRDIGKELKLL